MEKKKVTLSIAIAVYNEEANLDACLASVAAIADEIVVVDGGSTDSTRAIAKKHTNKIIQTDNPPIFHINKQKAIAACTGDWILQLDADEVIPEDLLAEIVKTINNKQETNGYYIPRKNYFWGRWMRRGGQYPDYVIRLVRRGKARFPAKTVHEQIEVEGGVGHLVHPMLHYSYKTRGDYWKKADTYTSLTAMELVNRKENQLYLFIQYYLIKPVMTFVSLYIRHKGFMDGLTGFEFALYSALHFPIAYHKYLKLI